jgi:hypothetical protein
VSIDPRPCRHNKAKKEEGNGEQHQQTKKKPLSLSLLSSIDHIKIETSNPVKTNPLFGRVSLFLSVCYVVSVCVCVDIVLRRSGGVCFQIRGKHKHRFHSDGYSQAPIFDTERRGPCVMYIPPTYSRVPAQRGGVRSAAVR